MLQSQPPFGARSRWEESLCTEHKDIACLQLALPSHGFVPAVENYTFAERGECNKVNMISMAWDSLHGSHLGHSFMDKTDDDMSLVNEDTSHQTDYISSSAVAAAAAASSRFQFNDHYGCLGSEEDSNWSPKDALMSTRAYYDVNGLQPDERSVGLVLSLSRDYPGEAAAVRETSRWIGSASKCPSPQDQHQWPPEIAAKKPAAKNCSSHEDHQAQNYGVITGSRNAPRICVDCKTTKTPLWRSGPHGPKSLCNACGIRYRKAKRALSAFGSGDHIAAYKSRMPKRKQQKTEDEDYKFVHHKKRSRMSIPSCKKNINVKFSAKPSPHSLQRVFAEDEKEAAVLLMALSAGLVHL